LPRVGFGAAANSFLDLVNVEEGDPINTIPSGLHRSKDPGVGAFTTYHDRDSTAKVAVKSGQELFVNYGQVSITLIGYIKFWCWIV